MDDRLGRISRAAGTDIALRLARPKQPGLVARRFGTLGFGLFASPAYLDTRGTPRKLQDLAKHDVIGASPRGPTPAFVTWLARLVPKERFVLNTSSLLAQQEAARAGWGSRSVPLICSKVTRTYAASCRAQPRQDSSSGW